MTHHLPLPGSLQTEHRASGRAHTPSQACPTLVGRHQLPQGTQLHLDTVLLLLWSQMSGACASLRRVAPEGVADEARVSCGGHAVCAHDVCPGRHTAGDGRRRRHVAILRPSAASELAQEPLRRHLGNRPSSSVPYWVQCSVMPSRSNQRFNILLGEWPAD